MVVEPYQLTHYHKILALEGMRKLTTKQIMISIKKDPFSRKNHEEFIQFLLPKMRQMCFDHATKLAEYVLMNDNPKTVQIIEYILDPLKNINTIEEHLKALGLNTDGSSWMSDSEDLKEITYADFYRGLSYEAQDKWDSYLKLELLRLGLN